MAELLVGDSFHPGGSRATNDLLHAAQLPRQARLLDVGCGLGVSARLAASEFGATVEAIDSSASIIERARARAGSDSVMWRRADATALPFGDASFDVVLAECVLSTVSRDAAVAELARVIRTGGSLLISDVTRQGRPVIGLEEHAVLGAALCVNEAWQDGELEQVLARYGLRIRRQWDRSDDILGLLERIEGRLAIAASVASRLDLPLDISEGLGALDLHEARALTRSVRAAVTAGTLGYFAAQVDHIAN